jgi:Tfp pilus assembly protein PilV
METPTHQEGRSEAGETLLEVLIASTLMAIAVVAILGALGTMLSSSTLHRDQTKANTLLVAASEKVKSGTRVACGTDPTSTYLGQARDVAASLPSGWATSQISVASIAYQTAPASGGVGFDTDPTKCSDALPLQRITVTVTSPDGRVKPSLTFVKGAL